jgi:outer membrane receptor protein involved in Fe transport
MDAKNNTTAAVKASLFVQNGVNYINNKGEAARLNPLLDLSLGGEVFFTKNIGVFLDVNNLLNQKRERWENYPTFGLNILGGVSARF